jgi:hypothetical protein
MKRSKKLKELKDKLNVYNKNLSNLDSKKFNEKGIVDFDIVIEMQKIETDIYYVRKQIGFIKKGQCFLGSSFEEINVNQYIK